MARSILPSKARKTARQDKQNLNQRNRVDIHRKLAPYKGPASDVIDSFEDDEVIVDQWVSPKDYPKYDDIVYNRRNADKLNHFMRWAACIVKDMEPQEAWDYLKTIVPAGLIGNHALTHLEFEHDPQMAVRWAAYTYEPRPEHVHNQKVNAELAAGLREIFKQQKLIDQFNHNLYHYLRSQMEKRNNSRRYVWDAVNNCYYLPEPETSFEFVKWHRENWLELYRTKVYIPYFYNNRSTKELTQFVATYLGINIEFKDNV
jgi:hypothetical protein